MTAPRVILATLLILTLSLVSVPVATATQLEPDDRAEGQSAPAYIAIIHAGSSGTCLWLCEPIAGAAADVSRT
ncbi:MAG: hypothetical protein FJW80_12215 [Actinobacteria bacterium]|nr:hypothetical protein [Actinomycetota bacterium]